MSEPDPTYTATIPGAEMLKPDDDDDQWLYDLRRLCISTLRILERELGLPQSIPERQR